MQKIVLVIKVGAAIIQTSDHTPQLWDQPWKCFEKKQVCFRNHQFGSVGKVKKSFHRGAEIAPSVCVLQWEVCGRKFLLSVSVSAVISFGKIP